MWTYSTPISCKYALSGINPIALISYELPEGVKFFARVDALPLSDSQRHDLAWGCTPEGLEPIVRFAAQEFCNRAPWSRA